MKLAIAALSVVTAGWMLNAPQSAPVTLSPTHDTYVDALNPDASYGNALYLSVENNSSTMERCYLEFDTSSLSGQTISSAILKVWVVRENSGGGAPDVFEVYPIYTAWTDALTYNTSALLTKGALVASVPSTNYGDLNPVTPPQPISFDVTSMVQSWASGGTNEGLVIQFPTTASADYRFAPMDDPDTTIRPVLIVTASGSAPPPSTPPPSTPPPSTPPPATSSSEGENGDGWFNDKCGGSIPWAGGPGALAFLATGLLVMFRRRGV